MFMKDSSIISTNTTVVVPYIIALVAIAKNDMTMTVSMKSKNAPSVATLVG